MQEVTDKYLLLEETEKNAVRGALIEERSRFCLFISCLKPVVVRTCLFLLYWSLADLRGRGTPHRTFFFISMQFLRKNGQILGWRPFLENPGSATVGETCFVGPP